ncbi:MAG: hypothetical protein HY784_12135 [Chloroflexi bacterium]|nr:hypothetical protein [Chloroflexota bacterium]
MSVEAIFESLVRRHLFASAEDAARKLMREYLLQQIALYRRQIDDFERRHGMDFELFTRYTAERTAMLRQKADFPAAERQRLAQAIMQDEDDWLEWKATEGILQGWLGLQ